MRSLEDHYWWFVSRRRLARMLLKKYTPSAKTVLDLGCGTGALLSELVELCDPIGLDFSEHAVAFCRERQLLDLVQGDAQSLPFLTGSIDAIVSLDTLEHVPDDQATLAEAFRVLKPGGTIVLNVPAYKWLWGPHDVALMHQKRYTLHEVRRLLRTFGFSMETSSYSVFFLFPIVVLIRAFDKLRTGPARVKLPVVPKSVNSALVILQDIEATLIAFLPLPWGSSVIAVGKKPDDHAI